MKQNRKGLAVYNAKRDFTKSPEPRGRVRKSAPKAARMFCVQKHLASRLHYDFRLEHRGVLLSWAIPKGPSLDPRDKRLGVKVEDHPLDYGEFEGVIPSGYGAGIVMLWDLGTWTPLDDDVDAGLKAGHLKFTLTGTKLKGSWALVRLQQSKNWLLIKHKDEWAGALDITTFAPDSVKTSESMAGILRRDKQGIEDLAALERGGETGKMLAGIIREARAGKKSKSAHNAARWIGKNPETATRQ